MALGFDGIEIPTFDGKVDVQRARDALSSSGLIPIIIGGGLVQTDIASEDASIRKSGEEYVKRLATLCADLGSDLICGPLYTAVGSLKYLTEGERSATLERIAASFRGIADFAQDQGVKIALEALCRYDTHLINTAAQAKNLVQKIDRENVGILLDTFHLNIEEKSMPAAIELAGEDLFHFHACENDRGAPGSGHVDWDGVARSLSKINYKGWIAIESFTPFDRNFASAMRVWRKFEDNQDEIASKGLSFLKSKLE